jgi:hypothetical protein
MEAITSSPQKHYDSKSRMTGDLGATLGKAAYLPYHFDSFRIASASITASAGSFPYDHLSSTML